MIIFINTTKKALQEKAELRIFALFVLYIVMIQIFDRSLSFPFPCNHQKKSILEGFLLTCGALCIRSIYRTLGSQSQRKGQLILLLHDIWFLLTCSS